MSKYKYEGYGVIRDIEIDFPYHTDDIVELLDEKDQQIAELEAKLAEKDKEQNQKAMEQLKKVKEFVNINNKIFTEYYGALERNILIDQINNQINEVKGE